jgi:protein-S-isoprenylcysteine O-methyltransferase Ste14
MFALLRHLLAIAALPTMVTIVIPWWIARNNATVFAVAATPMQGIEQIGGMCFIAIGLVLFVSSLRRFAGEGEGTLAPWDPPRNLVVRGPYRYVRNPMISGVLFIVFGEALVLRSSAQLEWALTFLLLNAVYIPLLEEPGLRRRFGQSYQEYCRHVPRLFPRLHPWDSEQ